MTDKPAPKPAKKKTGRKLLLNEALIEKISEHLENGATYQAAASMSGISNSTLKSWMQKGNEAIEKDIDNIYVAFVSAVTHARENWKQSLVEQIRQAGTEDWRALAWLLERQFPKEYGRKLELDGSLDNNTERTVKVEFVKPKKRTKKDITGEDNGGEDGSV